MIFCWVVFFRNCYFDIISLKKTFSVKMFYFLNKSYEFLRQLKKSACICCIFWLFVKTQTKLNRQRVFPPMFFKGNFFAIIHVMFQEGLCHNILTELCLCVLFIYFFFRSSFKGTSFAKSFSSNILVSVRTMLIMLITWVFFTNVVRKFCRVSYCQPKQS